MISLKNVSKSFGEQRVLSGFSLDIPDGGRMALMGRSGAGKTTVLNLIMGIFPPDSGEVSLPKGIKIGAVFQEDRLVEPLNAVANCEMVMKECDREKILNLLNELGIGEELAKKPTGELSGGEKRRIAIARAILHEPELLIMDEPFKGIDEQTLPRVIGQVGLAAAGRTLVLVTHSSEEAEALGCEVIKI